MDELLKQSWWALAWRGVAALLFGILALFWPSVTLLALVALFAAFALLSGTVSIIGAVKHRQTERGWWLMLLLGLVSVAAGVIAVIAPGITLFVLVLLIAAHALVTGVIDIVVAVRLRKQIEREWLLALAGALSIAFGVLVFLFPPAGALAMAFIVGVYATFLGVLLLALAYRAKRWGGRHETPSGIGEGTPRHHVG
jgi:uncharacterized membrane protein HdeD (DUF308 family)